MGNKKIELNIDHAKILVFQFTFTERQSNLYFHFQKVDLISISKKMEHGQQYSNAYVLGIQNYNKRANKYHQFRTLSYLWDKDKKVALDFD